MDHVVFRLSHVQEAHREAGDNACAVAVGLARNGRIATSAALIVVVVAVSFAVSDPILVRVVGIGSATAMFLDAAIVRVPLVPATGRLLGHLG